LSTRCNEPHPDDVAIICQKPAHDLGEHYSRDHDIIWDGNLIPVKRKRGSQAGVKAIIGSIPVGGNNGTVGPPASIRAKTKQAQEKGMADSYGAASEEFKAEARITIRRIAQTRPTLTTDDVWANLRYRGFDTHHRACMGTLIRNAAAGGLIEKTDQMKSTEREDQRAHGLIVWRSLIYRPEEGDGSTAL
jgi:hypothetical protein